MNLQEIVSFHAEKLQSVDSLANADWSKVKFELGETPNDVYGFFQSRANYTKVGRKKKFNGFDANFVPKIVINEKIFEKFPNIATDVIIPHEMGHACQWFANREPGHDQFFDWVMRKLNTQQGATFDHNEYGLSDMDALRINMLTGKQEKVMIEHIETGRKLVMTMNKWTRMLTNNRITHDKILLTRQNCRVIHRSSEF